MINRLATVFVTLLIVAGATHAQSTNLLRNPDADQGAASWRAFENARVEGTSTRDFCFVVRDGGSFLQDVELPDGSAGMYAVLIGRGSTERINANGAITGLPNLYGYMIETSNAKDRILEYLQGQQMLARPNVTDVWVTMWGVFKVPEKATKIRFFLNHAMREGVPHDGSAARFDNVGLYLFATRAEAEAFVSTR